MSHIVRIQTQVRDPIAVAHACDRLKLPAPLQGRHQLYSADVEGLGVFLPEWRYPVVCDTDNGELHYDNYNERWGSQSHLDRFLQCYAVCKTQSEARRAGHTVVEQQLDDGSIKLTVQVGGEA